MSLPKETMEILETLIPELKESEDEQVRKAMLQHFKNKTKEKWCNIPVKDIISWLEKQKESPKKELGKYSEEEELAYRLNWVMQDYYKAGKDDEEKEHRFKCYKLFWDALEDENFFEQKEQKTAGWSEDYREEDIQTRFAFYTYKDDPSVLYLSNVFVEETSRNHGFGTRILKAAEKAAEAIGAITICLKVKQDSPANAWYRKNGYGYVTFEDGYDWLEKNLEYIKPTKQEWSEEDTEMYINVASSLRGYACGLENEEHKRHIKKELDWLENRFQSLRPSWKPSEER